jgi:4-hydroxy-L-threonine phosphate dehydrogenase PdxA
MQRALQIVGSDIAAVPVQCIEDIDFVLGQLPIIDLENVNLDELEWGKIQQAAGQAAYEYITRAIDLAMTGQVGAVVTSAINKEALHLAVAGLNPHSGEGGVFGREEIEIIQPAIDLARSEGIDVVPYPAPPDTVFVKMLENKQFDAVIAQYHDQGHIAAKIMDFWGGVNITLGLPIIRTSVDHGTAFDIAGQGKANPQSLINAIKYARTMIGHSTIT